MTARAQATPLWMWPPLLAAVIIRQIIQLQLPLKAGTAPAIHRAVTPKAGVAIVPHKGVMPMPKAAIASQTPITTIKFLAIILILLTT